MNDRPSPADPLDRRIDQVLQRRFAVPASLDTLAERAGGGARRRAGSWAWLVLAAAAVLLWLLLFQDQTPSVRSPALVESLPGAPAVAGDAAPWTEAAFCRLVGPLLDEEPLPGWNHTPDLVRLYRDMDSCQREAGSAACGENDLIAESMSATYDQPLELRAEARGRLQGPFGSDQWPTGTIMTATAGDRTTVLIADRDTTHACCLRMELPENSGLRLFTAQLGDVILTEITPFEEPQLLACFE